MVTKGLNTSSSIYRRRIDGIPIRRRMKVGVIVQNISRFCDSTILLLIFFLISKEVIQYKIKLVISTKMVIIWSWKKISSSITGEHAFWNPILESVGIFKESLFIYEA